jgi:hypothetical protein
MLTIPGQKWNADQKHIKIPPHSCLEWLSSRILPTTNVGGAVGKKKPSLYCWWEWKLVQPLWKTVWILLKKLKIDLPYDPAISFLRIYPKECKSGYNKGTCTPMFIAALFAIAKLWRQPRCPTTNLLRKCGIYIQLNFIQP